MKREFKFEVRVEESIPESLGGIGKFGVNPLDLSFWFTFQNFPSVGPDGFASMLAWLGKGACSPLIQYFGWVELRWTLPWPNISSFLQALTSVFTPKSYCFFYFFFYLYAVSPISLLPEKPLFLFSFLLPFNFS